MPDESCRILIMDSLPYFDSLADRYEEQACPNSELINKRIAQKIEQHKYKGLSSIKKQKLEAYAYLVEAVRLLDE